MLSKREVISKSYQDLLVLMHQRIPTWGGGHEDIHLSKVMALQPKSVIDFGCGKGGLVRALREQGIEADGFDPGVKEWQQRPAKTYDLLTCLDVFEHVEPSHLVAMLDELRALADRALMVISHVPAGKRLPDGRNAHLIIKPRNWWEPLIAERWAIESWTEDGGVGTILARKVNNAVA